MNVAISSALIVMGGLGLLFGLGLAAASRIFAVHKDRRVEQIEGVLPGANCGACGAPGCSGFAEGVAQGKYPVNGCTVGGAAISELIAKIMGTEAGEVIPQVAVVRCRGDRDKAIDRAAYSGIFDCKAAGMVAGGNKGCVYGCLGLGTCVVACPFEAMIMGDKGLPVVDEDLCTGCGECVRACPRGIMELIPRSQKVFVGCVSKDFGKNVKAVCKVGCIGCSLCANPKNTANEIITMDDKLPVIHQEKVKDPWKDLENAVNKCPTKSFGVRGEIQVPVDEVEKEAAS